MNRCCLIEVTTHPKLRKEGLKMKLFKKLRKGFTLIELVVVIAVIAILSAVSVVSYVAITNRAKQSSDEQAVRQMNTALKASSILGAKDINELFNALAEEGMDAKNYKPLMKDTFFFWDKKDNQIVYAKYKDGQYVGLYPEAYKDKTKGTHSWYSLSKEIKTVDVSTITHSGTAYTVSSGEQLYSLMVDEKLPAAQKPTSITLSSDVDLMGADITFSGISTLDGGGKTLSNLSQLKHNGFYEAQSENKNSGLFGKIDVTGKAAAEKNITISNLVLDGVVIGSSTTGSCGVLAGSVYGGANITVSNVKIYNSAVYGDQKVGALFGYVDKGNITIDNQCEFKDIEIYSVKAECGKLIGSIGNDATKKVSGETVPAFSYVCSVTDAGATVSNINLHLIESKYTKDVTSWAKEEAEAKVREVVSETNKVVKSISAGKLVCGGNDEKTDAHNFRHFHADALFTIVNKSRVTYNTKTFEVYNNSGTFVGAASNEFIKGALPFLASMAA
jgi:prepilin-type N-terminal cleavage/methylation domain-containing protein